MKTPLVVMMTKKPTQNKTQRAKFEEAAREAETDDREEAFDATLRKIARVNPPVYQTDEHDDQAD